MRDDTVYLKTLAGLRRVHAILRRLDDDFCDPLELRATRRSACPACSARCAPGAWWSPTRWAAACSSRRPGWVSCRASRERLLGETLHAAVGGDLVVRRAAGARVRGCAPRRPGDQADLSESALRAACSAATWAATARDGADRAAARPAVRLRRAGAPGALAGAGAGAPGAFGGSRPRALDHPRLCDRDAAAAIGSCPAGWRASPPRAAVDIVSMQRGGGSKDIWVLRDPERPRRSRKPRGGRRARATRAPRRSALAAGGEPLLDGPLHRALRGQGAAAARDARGARRSAGLAQRRAHVPGAGRGRGGRRSDHQPER